MYVLAFIIPTFFVFWAKVVIFAFVNSHFSTTPIPAHVYLVTIIITVSALFPITEMKHIAIRIDDTAYFL